MSSIIPACFAYKWRHLTWMYFTPTNTKASNFCMVLSILRKMDPVTKFSLNLQILGLTLCALSLLCSAFTFQDYSDALGKSILFFEGQRSGRLPPNQQLTWRGNSGLSDGSSYHVYIITWLIMLNWTVLYMLTEVLHGIWFQVDLVGGYYDAGDNVKFGLPMAFTTTLLSWSVIEFGSSMQNHLENAKAAIRWGTDYLLKASTATPGALYVQVS